MEQHLVGFPHYRNIVYHVLSLQPYLQNSAGVTTLLPTPYMDVSASHMRQEGAPAPMDMCYYPVRPPHNPSFCPSHAMGVSYGAFPGPEVSHLEICFISVFVSCSFVILLLFSSRGGVHSKIPLSPGIKQNRATIQCHSWHLLKIHPLLSLTTLQREKELQLRSKTVPFRTKYLTFCILPPLCAQGYYQQSYSSTCAPVQFQVSVAAQGYTLYLSSL